LLLLRNPNQYGYPVKHYLRARMGFE